MRVVPPLLTMIAELIALPSVSSVSPAFDQGNRAVIDRLAEWFSRLGFECAIQPLDADGRKANLIATLGRGSGGLVLAGHTDTVPYDEALWQSDPLRLREADQRLYGLGSADMKSFFALVIEAVIGLQLRPQQLRQPLYVVATADEESSMSGAKALVACQHPKARYAVIGEPTNLRPVHAHKGVMMEAIHLLGRSGHSSNPALGINALDGMVTVMQNLIEWRQELQHRYRDEQFTVPMPTLNLGHIHGGDNPNRICGACELHIDLRPLPGMALEPLRQELHQRLTAALADSSLQLTVRPLFDGIPAATTPADAELVQLAERLSGYTRETVAYGTEAPYYQQLESQTLIFGAGSIAQAHQPDEFIALDQLQPAITALQGFIRYGCFERKK